MKAVYAAGREVRGETEGIDEGGGSGEDGFGGLGGVGKDHEGGKTCGDKSV